MTNDSLRPSGFYELREEIMGKMQAALSGKDLEEYRKQAWLLTCADQLEDEFFERKKVDEPRHAHVDALSELQAQIDSELDHLYNLRYHCPPDALQRVFIEEHEEVLNKLIQKHRRLVAVVQTSSGSGVTDEMIARAKSHPIYEFVEELDHGKIACPFHQGVKLQMSLDKETNLVRCWTDCGKSFDSIDLYMALNSSDFVTAVRNLQ